MPRVISTMIILFSLAGGLPAQVRPELTAEKLDEGLYLVRNTGGNVLFWDGPEGVLAVDCGTVPDHGMRLVDLIRKTTGKEPRFLVLTHYHYDHAGGAAAFPDSTITIAHDSLNRNMAERLEPLMNELLFGPGDRAIAFLEKQAADASLSKEERKNAERALALNTDARERYRSVKPLEADLTFSESLSVNAGRGRVRLLYLGPGHCRDNIMVLFPDYGILHTGDFVLNGALPYLDGPGGGSLVNWISVLEQLEKMEGWTRIVPGHGAVMSRDGLARLREMMTRLLADIRDLKSRNVPYEEALEEMQKKTYLDLPAKDLFPYTFRAVWEELDAVRP
ncbi:MAG: MBL fold metallo-hydrolase [Candidatus Aminicenantes bacterium]|nr:MBL fold metallo-hydrolase [Candidatus Aminicenantes bacterium]